MKSNIQAIQKIYDKGTEKEAISMIYNYNQGNYTH